MKFAKYLTLVAMLTVLSGCGWLGYGKDKSSKPQRAWTKDGMTEKQARQQINNCKQYLKGVHPKKQPVILRKCMVANGYAYKRIPKK